MKRIKELHKIETQTQYDNACRELDRLLSEDPSHNETEIDQLTYLIQKWDESLNPLNEEEDPIVLLRVLMKEHKMRNVDMADLLGLSKGAMSNILHYRRDLTRDHIRILATHFAISQDALNKPYELKEESKQVSQQKQKKSQIKISNKKM